MSLFEQLRRLYRKDKFPFEDYHTEVVAQVLRNNRALTIDWLQGIKATSFARPDTITIATQEEFPALADHLTDSRPDIAIRLVQDSDAELILVESKVGAKEGPDQLQRYTDQLRVKRGVDKTALVFITRDFEPDRSLERLAPNFTFLTTRWFKFYEYLKAHVNGDGLAMELKLFMEENKMSVRNQFTAIDTVALENFLAARALMDETLWGQVAQGFEAVLGKVSRQRKAMHELGTKNRYIIKASIGKNWDLEFLLGYFLPEGNPGESVAVGVMLGSNPKSDIRGRIVSALRDFARKSGDQWQAYMLDDEKEWCFVERTMPLQRFMAETDHVSAIKRFLNDLIKDVAKFKKHHPELPWATQRGDRDSDDS